MSMSIVQRGGEQRSEVNRYAEVGNRKETLNPDD